MGPLYGGHDPITWVTSNEDGLIRVLSLGSRPLQFGKLGSVIGLALFWGSRPHQLGKRFRVCVCVTDRCCGGCDRRAGPPRDCEVSDWTQWSTCSKSCDIGESTRTRRVVHHARRGGQPCPPLLEKKWCGSARSCNRKYFSWN